jgi:hypothetical protein
MNISIWAQMINAGIEACEKGEMSKDSLLGGIHILNSMLELPKREFSEQKKKDLLDEIKLAESFYKLSDILKALTALAGKKDKDKTEDPLPEEFDNWLKNESKRIED